MKVIALCVPVALGLAAVLVGEQRVATAASVEPQQVLAAEVRVEPLLPNFEIKLSNKNKAINVAILNFATSWDFSLIDPATVDFMGAFPTGNPSSKDGNNDGRSDRFYQFVTSKIKVTAADTIACLTADLTDGRKIKGCAKVKVVP